MEETHGASDLSRRNSVVQENNTVLNNNTDSTNDQDKEPLEGATNNNSENKVNGFQSEAEINPDQVVDEHVAGRPLPNDDDLNLEEVMKQRTNSISSLVAAHDAAIAHAAIQSHSALQASHHHQQQGQGQHHGVQVQPQSQQQQEQPQQANSTITVTHGAHEPHRSQADVLKDNLANMKEEMDSDCELVENEDTTHNGKNHLPNLGIANRSIVRPALTFDPPGSIQRPSIGTINIPSAFGLEGRGQNTSASQKLVPRGGPLPYNKCPLTSVDKLAEQNGHKAELQALRQEANRGDEYLSMSRFVRTLSKIIFDPGELMVDSVKDIDKNKIAILLTETQRWYRANMAEVRQTLSIRLSEIRKSKRAAHWQTGRGQVMPQGWPNFPQNGSMPRYMNESRYFSALPIGSRNLALTEGDFSHIREMDA